jgi:hypothetical protein
VRSASVFNFYVVHRGRQARLLSVMTHIGCLHTAGLLAGACCSRDLMELEIGVGDGGF